MASNQCYSYGSSSNPCSDEEQQTKPDQCAPLATSRKPVVFLPGLTGSKLDAKTENYKGPSFLCSKNSDWFNIWVSVSQLLPSIYKCTTDEWSLNYNAEDESVSQNPGTSIQYHGGEKSYGASVDAMLGWDMMTHALQAKG